MLNATDSDDDDGGGSIQVSMPMVPPPNAAGGLPVNAQIQAAVDSNLPVVFPQEQAANDVDQNLPANSASTSPTRMEVDDLPVAGDRAEDEFWPENANDMMDLDVGHVE